MSYPQNIVERFGGLRRMSRLTGYPPSTISSWILRGSIHDDHKPALLKAATENDVALEKEDFFPNTDGVLPTADR